MEILIYWKFIIMKVNFFCELLYSVFIACTKDDGFKWV